VADKSLHTNLQDLSIFTTRINVETFGFITSPISIEGTGLGLQFDHGFTSVRPVQPPSSAVGSPVVGYADPPRTSLTPVRIFKPYSGYRSSLSRPLSYLSTSPPGRQLDRRSTGRRYTDPSHTSLTPV